MMRILVITNHLEIDPAYRLRIGALLVPLRRRGVELTVRVRPKGLLGRWRLVRSAREFDGVLLHRKMLDRWECRVLQRSGRPVIYDVDDAVMYLQNRLSKWTQWRLTRRFHATARLAGHVAAGNEHLAGLFEARGCRTSIVPTVVDPGDYEVKQHAPPPLAGVGPGGLRLVWTGTSVNLPYVCQIMPALEAAREEVPGLRLLIICDRALDMGSEHGTPLPIDFIPWSVAGEGVALVQGDIGIAPTPCDKFTLGKCGFKIIQYMAAGLPVVASPVGANARLVAEGQTGFLANDLAGWTRAIVALAQEGQLRARMGAAGRQRILDEYTVEHMAEIWAKLWLGYPSREGVG